MKNKIDLLTATFKDAKIEEKYLDDKWIKVKSFYLKILYIFLIGGFSAGTTHTEITCGI